MRFGNLVEGRFVRRLNRFAALVNVAGADRLVHVANSGRMEELLVEGYPVHLKPAPGDRRKTAFDLPLVNLGHTLVSADARLPNALVYEALEEGRLAQFAGYQSLLREVTYGDSRLDLVVKGRRGKCFIEVKSVTLVVDSVGLFPDAPTTRGTKHVLCLSRAAQEGHRAAVIFVVQRQDAEAFSTNDDADPEFGVALRRAMEEGVEAYAYKCHVTRSEIVLADQLQVRL